MLPSELQAANFNPNSLNFKKSKRNINNKLKKNLKLYLIFNKYQGAHAIPFTFNIFNIIL